MVLMPQSLEVAGWAASSTVSFASPSKPLSLVSHSFSFHPATSHWMFRTPTSQPVRRLAIGHVSSLTRQLLGWLLDGLSNHTTKDPMRPPLEIFGTDSGGGVFVGAALSAL